MTTLVRMAEPAIKHWEQLLTRTTTPDINMVSLCARLGASAEVALSKIDKWIKWAQNTSSVKEQLWYIFIEHVRHANYFPTYANPVMAEYVIARDFKNKICVDIKRSTVQRVDYELYENNFDIGFTPRYPDYLLIKNLKLDRWETYLLWWIKNRRSPLEAARSTHIPFDTFKKEERYVWHLLKESYSKEA